MLGLRGAGAARFAGSGTAYFTAGRSTGASFPATGLVAGAALAGAGLGAGLGFAGAGFAAGFLPVASCAARISAISVPSRRAETASDGGGEARSAEATSAAENSATAETEARCLEAVSSSRAARAATARRGARFACVCA